MKRKYANSSLPMLANLARRAAGWLASKKQAVRHRPHSASNSKVANAADKNTLLYIDLMASVIIYRCRFFVNII